MCFAENKASRILHWDPRHRAAGIGSSSDDDVDDVAPGSSSASPNLPPRHGHYHPVSSDSHDDSSTLDGDHHYALAGVGTQTQAKSAVYGMWSKAEIVKCNERVLVYFMFKRVVEEYQFTNMVPPSWCRKDQ